MSLRGAITGVALVALLCACKKNESTPAPEDAQLAASALRDARNVAEEAYVYAYPMMESYRTMYVQAVDRTAPGYLGPLNEITHKTELLGPDFGDIVRPNNDTLYSLAWLNLRAQPIVITVPEIEGRYYSIQLVDMFTHNFGYVGTRATAGEAGSYAVAGPHWIGTPPKGVKAVFRSESDFVYCIVRIEVRGPEDVSRVNALQRAFRITPLHAFLGRSTEPVASGVTFPAYDGRRARSAGFIDLLSFLLAHVKPPEEERELMERFASIGIEPAAGATSLGLDDSRRNAVEEGVGRALVAIGKAADDPSALEGVRVRSAGGWSGVDGLFGDGDTMRKSYLARASGAMVGLYGNDAVEAYYPSANRDAEGEALDGSKHSYVMRFERDEIPEVDAFWSITMYRLPEQLMVENPIDRYSIGSHSELAFAKDGSLTLYIQHASPGKRRESNWLPAPDGPFSLQLRMYLPSPEMLDPLYLPPPVDRAE